MPTPVKDGTAVTKWLTDQGAGDFFIDAFYDDGYYSMVDVNAEVINRLVTRPGLAAQLIRALPKPDPKPKRDSSVPKDGTAVTKWLKEHKAGDFIDAFYDQGYDSMDHVTAEVIKELVTRPGLAAELITSLKPKRDSSVPKDGTAVTQWLKEHKAGAFVDVFYNEGYDNKEEVTAEVINRLVTPPGLAAELITSLKPEPQPEPQPKRDPLPIPALKPGIELDLSTPEISTPDGSITFQLPAELSAEVREKAIVSANSLKTADWMVIARDSQLLYGIRMDGDTPRKANTPILNWVVPKTTDFVRAEHLEARTTSDLTYTEESAKYTRSAFNSQSASLGLPFCAASFERSERERQASASYNKRLYMNGMWRYPRATVYLKKCTRVSRHFVTSIRKALRSADPATELDMVFAEYGHAIPTQILLGGQLYFQQKREVHGDIQEKEVESTITAAVNVKVEQAGVPSAEGDAKTSFQAGSASKITAHEIAEEASFQAFGGDTTLASSPILWRETVKDPRLWAVIENDELYSTINLLDDDLRKQVLAIWERRPSSQRELDGLVVTIRTSAKNPQVLGREVNARNQTTPHPLRMPDWVLTNPKRWGVVWRLRFSGLYEDKETKSNPLFWIELVDQKVLLTLTKSIHLDVSADKPEQELLASEIRKGLGDRTLGGEFAAFTRPRDGAFAAFASLDEVLGLSDPTESDIARRALWYVKPVDPSHFFGNVFKDAYFLKSLDSGLLLSSQADASTVIPDVVALDTLLAPTSVHSNVHEFSVLVKLEEKTNDQKKLASCSWFLKPLTEGEADGKTKIRPDELARRDYYLQVKRAVAMEPWKGTSIEENGGQQEWLYGVPSSPNPAVVIVCHKMDYQEDWQVGWREHTFEFGPDPRYLIVGWQVISHWGDGTNGSWWKATEQILLTHYAAVHVKSNYDRGCSWGLRVYYVEAKDYQF